MTGLRKLVTFVCFSLVVGFGAAPGATLESTKFKFEVLLEANEKEATAELDAEFLENLSTLRSEYQKAGDLDAVLAVQETVEAQKAGEELPQAKQLKLGKRISDYRAAKTEATAAGARDRRDLYAKYLAQLEAIKAGGGKDAAAIDKEIATVRESIQQLEHGARFTIGTKVRGRMHINVDDKVTFYVNGKKWYSARRSSKNKGSFVSPPLELTVGDHLLASARNSGGGYRHVKFVFVSEDEKQTIEFRVADFMGLRKAIGDRREFTLSDLKSDLATPARKDADKSGNPFDFENLSEWVWGEGNHCLLGTVIKPEMCRMR